MLVELRIPVVYRVIIKYIYLNGLRGKEIYEDIVNTLSP